MNKTAPSAAEDARQWFRHRISANLFFMVTEDGQPLDPSTALLDGVVEDVSETGFRFKSPMPLNNGDQISFEIASQQATVFSGVGEVVHGNNELVYGVQYIKIKKQ